MAVTNEARYLWRALSDALGVDFEFVGGMFGHDWMQEPAQWPADGNFDCEVVPETADYLDFVAASANRIISASPIQRLNDPQILFLWNFVRFVLGLV